jgi:hypothetical protein
MPSTASVVIAAKILLIKVRERQRGEGAAFFVFRSQIDKKQKMTKNLCFLWGY